MAETTTKTRITQVGTVIVPVTDQDRAVDFYVEKLGFEKRSDTPFGRGDRWIEVAPAGATGPRQPSRRGGRRRRGGHAHGGPRATDVLLPRPGREQPVRRTARLKMPGRGVARSRGQLPRVMAARPSTAGGILT
jgi:catechol 2,3-dioxygenase-like lactoylglutathione lyase family enzyme